MSRGLLTAMACCVAIGFGAVVATGGEETKSTAQFDKIDTSMIWNFHYEGKKKKGSILELTKPKDAKNRTLVITKLELRMRQSTRVRLIEHNPLGERRGKKLWKKVVRRSELFSLGKIESTSKWVVADYDSLMGIKFNPGARPSLELTQGGGDIAVYAEGYWSRP